MPRQSKGLGARQRLLLEAISSLDAERPLEPSRLHREAAIVARAYQIVRRGPNGVRGTIADPSRILTSLMRRDLVTGQHGAYRLTDTGRVRAGQCGVLSEAGRLDMNGPYWRN
jgi:hypothetical protein